MTAVESHEPPIRQGGGSIYNSVFWLSYVANVGLVTANALTFRFAEWVAYLGGTEQVAGQIVGAGITGALVARLFLGQAIDRYGVPKLWLASAVLFAVSCGSFLVPGEVSWVIYAARTGFSVGLAGMFTCSMVYIQNQVPPGRRTEMIASLGSSGFVGMITGSQLGDWILRAAAPGRAQFLVLFGTAAGLATVYLAIVVYLTRRERHTPPAETPNALKLALRYWPGTVLLAALMMGIAVAVTTVFLTRFATHLGLQGIGTFFTAYSLTAFVFRIASRRWSRVVGRHRMILLGLSGHAVAMALLPLVTREWHFVVPAFAGGFAHALLFPAVVSLGSGAFPVEYRGTGTTVVLGFIELGIMVSSPILGWIIDHHGFTAMFCTASATAVVIGVIYRFTAARTPDDDLLQPQEPARTEEDPAATRPAAASVSE